ncbi:cellulose synthase subunit BcsC-related outer membrane protein [Halochromatium sp.]
MAATGQDAVLEQQTRPQLGLTDVTHPDSAVELSSQTPAVEIDEGTPAAQVQTADPEASVQYRADAERVTTPPSGTTEPAREHIYSAGRRAEPALWALLHRGQYTRLKQDIAQLRADDPSWQPPAELLHWLDHHLAEQGKTRAAPGRAAAAASKPAPPPDPYGVALARAGRLQDRGQSAAALQALTPWLKTIRARRDSRAMTQVGWLRLTLEKPEPALAAFQQALQWRPSDDAAKGELLALSALGEVDPLLLQAESSTARWPALREPAADALRALAARLHQQDDYADAARLLKSALVLWPADRDAALLTAWNDFKLGRYRAAADAFEALYRAESDEQSADGLLLSLKRLGDDDQLRRLAQAPGPLHALWQRDQAETLFSQGQFLSAYRLDPDLNPALVNIDSPALGLGLGWRSRTGEPGLGQLNEQAEPLLLASGWLGAMGVTLAIERVSLDAGKPAPDALIGSWPAPQALAGQERIGQTLDGQAEREANRVDGGLSWRLQLDDQRHWLGGRQLSAAIGQTPTGGALDPAWLGSLRLGQRRSAFAWNATLEHQPVSESILSYTGMRDPASGDAWGRVSRTGLVLDGWRLLTPDWTLAGLLRAHAYRGTDVADNSGYELGLSLGRNLKHPDFAYLTLGPALEARHFERNLNQFTLGHGGYYSPDLDLGLMLALDFQTREAAPWLLRGSARAGWRIQDEADSPWFPLGLPSDRATDMVAASAMRYPSSRKQGLGASLQLQGAVRLSPHWQLGVRLSGSHSPQFDELSGMLFLHRFFEPRAAVFSSDLLPAGLGSGR